MTRIGSLRDAKLDLVKFDRVECCEFEFQEDSLEKAGETLESLVAQDLLELVLRAVGDEGLAAEVGFGLGVDFVLLEFESELEILELFRELEIILAQSAEFFLVHSKCFLDFTLDSVEFGAVVGKRNLFYTEEVLRTSGLREYLSQLLHVIDSPIPGDILNPECEIFWAGNGIIEGRFDF